MKKIIFSLFSVLLLALGAQSAHAFNASLGLNANVDVDDKSKIETSTNADVSVKDWSFSSKIIGTVTATNGSTITVKADSGATYTVDVSNAHIRRGSETVTQSSISVNDSIYVQGAVNESTIVATNVIVAKPHTAIKSTAANDRPGVIGTVTAVNDTTITLLGKNGTTYTVAAANAKIWENKKETSDLDSVNEGDTVIIQGTMSGENISAANIFEVKLPEPSSKAGTRGTVTAITGSTFTMLTAEGKYYTVTTDEASVKTEGDSNASLSDIHIGDSVLVKGDLTGTTIDANTIVDMRLGKGFFSRFGLFFKNLFRK